MNTSDKLLSGFEKTAKDKPVTTKKPTGSGGSFNLGNLGQKYMAKLQNDPHLRNGLIGAALGGLSSYFTGAGGLTSALAGGALGLGGTYYNQTQKEYLKNLAKLKKIRKNEKKNVDKGWWDGFYDWTGNKGSYTTIWPWTW